MQVLTSTAVPFFSSLEGDNLTPVSKKVDPITTFCHEEDISDLLVRFTKDPTVSRPLCKSDLSLIDRQYRIVNNFCREKKKLSFEELITQAHYLRTKAKGGSLSEDERLELIAIGRLALHHHFDIYPYNTQVLSLLGVLIGEEKRQAQIKTGEGKSIIVALWAFVMAMECRGVDIITSSRYLAIRDQERFAPFFERCGIISSHICHDDKRPSHFRAQILYGPVFDFEFAWMSDKLSGTLLYEERLKMPYVLFNFDAVCVDESDNLLIDTAANGARLSFPAEESYDWIYSSILSFVKLNENKGFSQLRDFICQKVSVEKQEKYQTFSDKQIETWIASAQQALFKKKENVDYVVKSCRSETREKKYKVQIIDLQTGRISERSRWSRGIHEFLEIKHHVALQEESIVPISLSHAVFYQMYRTVIALTGTAEHTQTAHIYKITTFHVPPHKHLIREDLPLIFAENTKDYYAKILGSAEKYINLKRPLLILCETIRDSQKLEQQFKYKTIPYQMLNEIQEEEEDLVIKQAGLPGKVTIATNTAGRGTDIILNSESIGNGGLHVVVTFYPDSEREEQQAIGRAGRQGQPGSSQIIVNKESSKMKKILFSVQNKFQEIGIDEKTLMTTYRRDIEANQITQHIARAALERFLSEKTSFFFDTFRAWVKQVHQKTFLDAESQRLCKVKLTVEEKNTLDFGPLLAKKDYALAEEAVRLLCSDEPNWMHWKILLKKIVERMEHKIIREWSLQFFQPATEQIVMLEHEEAFIKYAIEESFDNHRLKWEKYLHSSGLGIFLYLEELIGKNGLFQTT